MLCNAEPQKLTNINVLTLSLSVFFFRFNVCVLFSTTCHDRHLIKRYKTPQIDAVFFTM